MTTDPEAFKQGLAGVFDRAAESYDNVGVDYFTAFGRRLVALAGLRPGDVVLDAGCGRGAATFPAAEAVGERGRVEAIDLAPAMVTLTAAAAPPNVTVAVGDAEAPSFDPGTFDAVLSAFVIFMLPDPLGALRRYKALLRDGGTVALSQFPGVPPGKWAEVGGVVGRYLGGGPGMPRADASPVGTPERLADALREAGFADVRQETEQFDIEFRDLDQWWAWAWSQGQRGALERVPADRLDDLKADLYDLLGAGVPEGEPVRLTQPVTFTVARA
ncbi:MAG TPA: methyltransferase domain-containing protein [Frankiaceae bacterium]|nr:methyltransferase domain-containing protein [Frankiaceae bacterium]